jgi:hypothetical protein
LSAEHEERVAATVDPSRARRALPEGNFGEYNHQVVHAKTKIQGVESNRKKMSVLL